MYSAGQGLSVADIFDIFIIIFLGKEVLTFHELVDIAFLWKKKQNKTKKTKQKKNNKKT